MVSGRGILACLLVTATMGWAGAAEAPQEERHPVYREHLERARGHLEREEFQPALEELKEAIRIAPSQRQLYELLSEAYVQLERDEEAIRHFARLATLYPATGHASYYKGQHEARLGRQEALRASLEQAVSRDPQNAENHLALARLCFSLSEFKTAAQEFAKAFELDGASVSKAMTLIRVLRILGRYDEAEQVTDKPLLLSPDSAELQYAWGALKARRGRTTEAEKALRRSIALDPTADRPQRELAGLLLRTGRVREGQARLALADRLRDYAEMSDSLRERMRLNPDNPAIPLALAELELTVRNNNAAVVWLSRAEELDGSPERIAAGRAWVFFSKADMAGGEQELAKIEHSRDGVVELARAARLIQLGRNAEALRTLERALADGSHDKSFLRRAADLYATLGREDRSRVLLLEATTAPFLPE